MGWLPILFYLIIGLAVMAGLGWPRRSMHAAGGLALAWILGLGATTLVIMTAALATGRLYFEIFWAILAASAGVLAWRRRDLREMFTMEILPEHEPLPQGRAGRAVYFAACGLMAAAILASIYWVMSFGLSHPLTMSDALTNFAHKARLWFDTRQLMPELLKDPEYLMYKRRYPAVIPLTEAVWSFIFGDWDGVRLKFIFITSWVAIGGLIFALLIRRTGLLAGLLGAAFWMTLPFHLTFPWGGPIDGFADLTYALALVAGVAIAAMYDRERGGAFALLAGLAAAGAMLVKQEGVIAWGLLFLYFLWRRAKWRDLAIIAGVMVFVMALNKLTVRGLPDHFEGDLSFNIGLSELLGRIAQVPGLLLAEFKTTRDWGTAFWLVMGAFLIFRTARVHWRRLISLELFMFAAILGIYMTILMFTARDFHNNFDWAFQRLFIHIVPLLCVIAFSDFRLAAVESDAAKAIEAPAAAQERAVTLADAAPLIKRCSLQGLVIIFCVAMIVMQTRENRSINNDRLEEMEEIFEADYYHPLALIVKPWKIYGKAVQLMDEDGSEKFWFHGERYFYPPKLLNLHLYPRHGIYMNVKMQEQITKVFQYGREDYIVNVPPEKYDRILHITLYKAELVTESDIGFEK